ARRTWTRWSTCWRRTSPASRRRSASWPWPPTAEAWRRFAAASLITSTTRRCPWRRARRRSRSWRSTSALDRSEDRRLLDRRQFLKGWLGRALAVGALGCRESPPPPPRWSSSAFRKTDRSRVAVLSASSYTAPLEDVVRRGLELFAVDVRGLRVVLKPNLV